MKTIRRRVLSTIACCSLAILFLGIACAKSSDSGPVAVSLHLKRTSGAPYSNEPVSIWKSDSVGSDSAGNGITDNDGVIVFTLEPVTNYILSISKTFVYAMNGEYVAPVGGNRTDPTASYTIHEVPAIDPNTIHSTGTGPTITTETMFATSIALAGPVDFCYAGIGIIFGWNYVPPDLHVSVYADNSGVPDSTPLLDSSDVKQFEMLTPAFATAGGMAGNLCDVANPVRSLPAGTYWIVATFTSPPNTCVPGGPPCFHVLGTINMASDGLPAEVSSDGGTTWTPSTFTAGGETRQSLTVFFAE